MNCYRPVKGDLVRVRERGVSGRVDPRRTWAGPVVSVVDEHHVKVKDLMTTAIYEVHISRLEPTGSAKQRTE